MCCTTAAGGSGCLSSLTNSALLTGKRTQGRSTQGKSCRGQRVALWTAAAGVGSGAPRAPPSLVMVRSPSSGIADEQSTAVARDELAHELHSRLGGSAPTGMRRTLQVEHSVYRVAKLLVGKGLLSCGFMHRRHEDRRDRLS